MNQNRFTLQEKQMPSIRLPLRIAVLCCIDLFVAFIMVMVILAENNIPGAIAILVVLALPATVGLTLYSNHLVRFDKDNIVYRDFARHIHRYRIGQIDSIDEGKLFTYIHVGSKRIAVNNRTQNSHWLLELAGMKQNSEEITKSTKKEERAKLIQEVIIFSGIALVVAVGFTIVTWFAWNDHASRFLVHFFALFAIGGYVTAITIPLLTSPLNPIVEEDGSMKGHYLINKDGSLASGVPDRYLISGTLFFIAGFLLNVITIPLYLLSALCFAIFFIKHIIIRFLHRCPEWIVKHVLENHAPSEDLKARMPQKYDRYIDHTIILQWNNDTEEENTKENEDIADHKSTPFFVIAAFAALATIVFFFNIFLHDSRFESTANLEVSFEYGSYENSNPVLFGKTFRLTSTKEYFDTKTFIIKGFDQYGTNQELFLTEMDGETVFHITVSRNVENEEVEILTCTDEYDNEFLSEEDCRARNKKSSGTITAALATLVLVCFIIGIIFARHENQRYKKEDIKTKDFHNKVQKNENIILFVSYAVIIAAAFLFITLFEGNEKEDLVLTETQLTDYRYLHDIQDKIRGDAWLDLLDEEENIYSVNRYDLCGENEALLLSKIEAGNTTFTINGAIRDYGLYIYELSDDNGIIYITEEKTIALIEKQEKTELRNNLLFIGGILTAAILYTLISRRKKKKTIKG